MKRVLTVLLLLASGPVFANDTVVEIGAGGLEYMHSESIQMMREDLYISAKEVRVDYVFRNYSDEGITTFVAFPMPDIVADPFGEISIPFRDDNFLGFSVKVDGNPIAPILQQRVSVLGIDMTRVLSKLGIPLFPFGTAVEEALGRLDSETLQELAQRGLVQSETFDQGNGPQQYVSPLWALHSVYYWEMYFPAGQDIGVSHVYTPAVGATTGLSNSFLGDEVSQDYARRYCVDDGFARAVKNRIERGQMMFESWISYILTTGDNWYNNIGTFHLTVDKGSVDNLVSFCGEGVVKTGPTTFELTYEDFSPQEDLDFLILLGVENL